MDRFFRYGTIMHLWQKIIIGMVLGIIAGIVLGDYAEYIKPFGDLFIRLIKMLVVPLVFFSLISGVTSMGNPKAMGRIGIKALSAYLITTVFAISIGLAIGFIVQPGVGAKIDITKSYEKAAQAVSISKMLLDIVPVNPAASLADGNILQIIFFALFFGIAAVLAGDKAKSIIKINNALADIMYQMTNIVMLYAPIGVFALMAWVSGTHGIAVLLPLGKVIACVFIASIIHMVVVYGGFIKLFLKLNPIKFFRHIRNAQAVAFSTSSSSATLPVTIKVSSEKLGVSKSTATFVLPLGTTINMDGSAIYQGICALFIAQAVGVDLSSGDIITIILTATLASIGTAGIPGAGLIMLTLVLSSVGLPIEAVAIVAGVDRILDMMRTCVNVTGDTFVAMLVDKSENTFDEGKYNL